MNYIGIIGSRSRDSNEDYELTKEAFLEIYKPGDKIVSGGCKAGGDRFAKILVKEFLLEDDYIEYPPDISPWKDIKQKWMFTKANYDRNTLIAEKSTVLIACVEPENIPTKKGGTMDTVKKFIKFWKGTKPVYYV